MPVSEQHKNITIHSPRDSDYEHPIEDATALDIEVQQVYEESSPVADNVLSKAEVPVISA
jgi:hypothetical protein